MSTLTMERPMATKRNDTTAKIDVQALSMARKAAGIRGLSLAEYLSVMVMEQATKEVDEWATKRAAEIAKAKKPKS